MKDIVIAKIIVEKNTMVLIFLAIQINYEHLAPKIHLLPITLDLKLWEFTFPAFL